MDTLNLPSFSLSGRVLVRTALLKSTSQSEGAPYSTCWPKTASNVGWTNPMNTNQTKQCTNAKKYARLWQAFCTFPKFHCQSQDFLPFQSWGSNPFLECHEGICIFSLRKFGQNVLLNVFLQHICSCSFVKTCYLENCWHHCGWHKGLDTSMGTEEWDENTSSASKVMSIQDSIEDSLIGDFFFFVCGKMNMKKSPSWLRCVQLQVQKKHISMACTQQMYSYKFWQTFQSSSISGFLTFL